MLGFQTSQRLQIIDKDFIKSRYYIRILVDDKPGVLEQIASILSQNNISVSAFLQKPSKQTSCAKILLATHITTESSIRKALFALDNLAVVQQAPVIIRIDDE